MIVDIFNEVYTKLKTTITTATFSEGYPSTIPSFPTITVSETSNVTDETTIDSSGEVYNDLTFEINIFTKGTTRSTDAKAFRKSVDVIMSDFYGMSRDFAQPVPNFLDTNIYRITMRYSCRVNSNKAIYRR